MNTGHCAQPQALNVFTILCGEFGFRFFTAYFVPLNCSNDKRGICGNWKCALCIVNCICCDRGSIINIESAWIR